MRWKFLILLLVILLTNVFAHGQEIEKQDYSLQLSAGSFILILLLIIYSLHKDKLKKNEKTILFSLMVLITLTTTFYLSYSTISLNMNSITKGPVHWHADFEFWACGEKLDLIDPEGFFNRVGSPVYHEHNDNRIHVEGVVTDLKDINLHEFFEQVDAEIEKDRWMFINHNNEKLNIDKCNGKKAFTQVFLLKVINPENTKNWVYNQEKLEDYDNYVISPYTAVPPGDCIIIEFDERKEKTKHSCESYKTSIRKGELSGS